MPAEELESDIASHAQPTEHCPPHAQNIEQGREVVSVGRHAVAALRCLTQAMAEQVGRDPSPAVKRRDLAAPHRAVEHEAMDEQYRRALAHIVIGEADA